MNKTCKVCGATKPIEEFRPARRLNKRAECKTCEYARGKEYRNRPENRQRYLDYNRAYRGPKKKRNVTRKACSACKKTKPIAEFSPHRHTSTGHTSRCKACNAEARRAYYRTVRGGEMGRAYARQFYHSQEGSKFAAEYRKSAKRKQTLKEYSQTESFKRAQRRYGTSPKGRLAKVASSHRRRVRLKQNGNCEPLTRDQIEAILVAHDYRCVYCGATDCKLEIDHQNPVELGGDNSPANLVPACVPCNRAKGPRYWELGCRLTAR